MLSYRHAFHAGNFADVHKHIVLSLLVQNLLHKETPFCYLDSHAASGRYDLHGVEAQKNVEYRQGILRLWQQDDVPEAVRPYLAAVRSINPSRYTAAPRYYPGSPLIVRHFLRPQDRMVLSELHPADFQLLHHEFAADRQVTVHQLDGYQGIKAFLPPKERRGVVLIDPAFERRGETSRMVTALLTAYKRWEQGVYALWFPITNRNALTEFYRLLTKTGIRKILGCELCVHPSLTGRNLNGSVMVIVNPPWRMEESLRLILPWLAQVLAENEEARQRVEWLVGE